MYLDDISSCVFDNIPVFKSLPNPFIDPHTDDPAYHYDTSR